MLLKQIGVVHSSVTNPREMPHYGVRAEIEVFPEFAGGLEGIETNTHVVVIGWLHEAKRDFLQVKSSKWGEVDRIRGIFGLRSSSRPNPLGLTPARLLRRDGLRLFLERLDMVEGTPVLDIKRYSPGWDCLFAARSSRNLVFPSAVERQQLVEDMFVEGANFHGEDCRGVALGARIMVHAMESWRIGPKDRALLVSVGEDGCIADALQGLSGATLGNGRLKVPGGRIYRLELEGKALAYYPRETDVDLPVADILEKEVDALFAIREEAHVVHKPKGAMNANDVDPGLLEMVTASLVDGKLPCAVAFKIARDRGLAIKEVGRAADVAKVKISLCQMGCFR